MTLIDHRILVHAPPEVVWELLSDFAATPKWQQNCAQANILTTHKTGTDVRVRLNMKRGSDHVMEILSWYNNLGYEYTIIEGPFDTNRGIVRLQVIPEGTVVQWTFEYQTKGFGSGLRNRLSLSRNTEQDVADSLKLLKKLVESTGIRMDAETSQRVALRPAPSAKERAKMSEDISRTMAKVEVEQPDSKKPEVDASVIPETLEVSAPADETVSSGALIEDTEETAGEPINIIVPPVSDDDTKPNEAIPAVVVQEVVEIDEPEQELAEPAPELVSRIEDAQDIVLHEDFEEPPTVPQSLDELIEATDEVDDDAPTEVIEVGEETTQDDLETAEVDPEPTVETPGDPTEAITIDETTEAEHQVETPAAEDDIPAETDTVDEPAAIETSDEEDVEPQPVASEPQESLFEKKLDPMGPSIWEVFGMEAPSEQKQAPTLPEIATEAPVSPLNTESVNDLPVEKAQFRTRHDNKQGLRRTQARASVRSRQ